MRALWTVVRTSILLYYRQPAAWIVSFAVPIMMMVVFGSVFGGMGGSDDLETIDLIVVDEDHSTGSAKLIERLSDSETLAVHTSPTVDKDAPPAPPYDRPGAEAAVREGDVGSALVIPAGFEATFGSFSNAANAPQLTILTDTSQPIQGAVISGLLQQTLFMSFSSTMAKSGIGMMAQELNVPKPIATLMGNWIEKNASFIDGSGTESGGSNAGSPFAIKTVDVLGEKKTNPVFSQQMAGVLTMFMLFSVTGAGASLLRERDSGTLRRVLLTPIPPETYLIGKYLAFFIQCLIQTWVMFLAGWAIFHVDIWTPLAPLAFFSITTALAATAFGILLAALCKTSEQVSAIATLLILTMSAVGGSMMPRELMPPTLKMLGNFTFNGWAMQGYTDLFWRGGGFREILPEAGVMVGIAVVFTWIAASIFSKRFAQ
ncbi:MAG: ABC transporter permease [bacterium]